jgi:hypothetical protein
MTLLVPGGLGATVGTIQLPINFGNLGANVFSIRRVLDASGTPSDHDHTSGWDSRVDNIGRIGCGNDTTDYTGELWQVILQIPAAPPLN